MQIHSNLFARSAVFGAVAGFFALFAVPGEALAQDDSATAVDEITVTARRREESLQDVPIAVSAFSGEMLEESGAVNVTALSNYTPNVTLEVSRATNTTLTAYSRVI